MYGGVPLDRPVYDFKVVNEDLLGLLPPPPNNDFEVFGPTVWDEIAYKKSFEKFEYADYVDFEQMYPECVAFADKKFLEHFNFLSDSSFVNILATDKNVDSTPAYPKMRWWLTESDYKDGVPQFEHIVPKYSPNERVFSEQERKDVSEELSALQSIVDGVKKEDWEETKKQTTDALNHALYVVDKALAQHGYILFEQRMRPKNGKRGPRRRTPNTT